MEKKVQKSEAEWRSELSEEEYRVLRASGTEAPFSGQFNLHFEDGNYACKGCGTVLFESSSKFDGHCGWPSFDDELPGGRILKIEDFSHGMLRTEIRCATCESHLGHIFNDGPTATGIRYCVNSVALDFNKKD